MKNISISNKVKILTGLLIITVFSVIAITIYLNQKNVKDALIMNIAGKQRMLTQNITKNIFYLYQFKSENFKELDKVISNFNYGLKILKEGDQVLEIEPTANAEITAQIDKVIVHWRNFEKHIEDFKTALIKRDKEQLTSLLQYFHTTNTQLLQEVDASVSLYTMHIEEKTNFIKKFQYLAFFLLLIFTIYSITKLQQIEQRAKEFIAKSKEISTKEFIAKSKEISTKEFKNIEFLNTNVESEFVEVADNFNCFINKVSSAMNYSQIALEQSKIASEKLEDLTDEFNDIIDELQNKPEVSKQLNKSEDIVIESSEDLIKSTKKLKKLKSELDKILTSCKSNI